MQVLTFICANQILTAACPGVLVVENSRRHVFAEFQLDKAWDGLSVTAVFTHDFRGSYERVLNGTPVEIPPEVLVRGRLFVSLVGLKDDGEYRLTTKRMDRPLMVAQSGSITALAPEEQTPELWEQLLAQMGDVSKLDTIDKSSLVAAINEVRRTGGGGTGGGVAFDIDDETLKMQDGVLRVNTINAVEQDSRQPITSGAVYTEFGKIVALLETI